MNRTLILDYIQDMCSDFLYYDRKEDEDLSEDDIINAVKDGIITIDDMVDEFRRILEENL